MNNTQHYDEWKLAIDQKFNSQCHICGSTKNLRRHHINTNPLDNRIENILLICSSCHRKIHSIKFVTMKDIDDNKLAIINHKMDETKKIYTRILPTVLTDGEVREFFNVIDNFRNILIFKMIYYLGIRNGELLTIKFEDINIKEGIIKIKSEKKRKGMIAERLQPIPKELKIPLESYLNINRNIDGLMFNITTCRVWQLMKQYIKRTTIKKTKVTVHTLRHSYATHIYEKTGNIQLIKSLLGHESIATTSIYTHLSTGAKKKLVSQAFD